MSKYPWLRWVKPGDKAFRGKKRRPHAFFPLQLEELETRLTPSVNQVQGILNPVHSTSLATIASSDANTPVAITTTVLSDWTQNSPNYYQSIVTSGGTTPIIFGVVSGNLPPGLNLNSANGTISGIPVTQGNYTFTIEALDFANTFDTHQYTVNINAPVAITTTSLPNWTVNIAGYNQTVHATGGTGSLTFSVTNGTLPRGLSLDPSTGIISGTPNTQGSSPFTIKVVDAAGSSYSQQFRVNINSPVAITTNTLESWTQNSPGYSQTILATAGTSPLSFSVSAGNLPHGLSLDSTSGAISGTPDTQGSATFTIEADDAAGASNSRQYTVNINPPVAITTPSLNDWTQNASGYSQTIIATGGIAPVTFSVAGGTLPHGLNLNKNNGTISGTPDTQGTSTFSIKADDSTGSTAIQQYTVNINAPVAITTTSLPNWTVNIAGYNQIVQATGGTGSLTFNVTNGALPRGFSLDPASGIISGTPNTQGSSPFTIKVVDAAGSSYSEQFRVSINSPVVITTTTLKSWTQNSPGYNQTILATVGTIPLSFSVSAGNLPSGLSLDSSSGAITGTPDTPGISTFTIQADDAAGATYSRQYTVNINPPVAITTTSLNDWTQKTSGYSETIMATGGTAPVTFSVDGGTLPHGLSLNKNTGAISGTPDSQGTSTFSIKADDSTGSADIQQYTVNINASLAITTTGLADWTANIPNYSQTLNVTGGTGTVQLNIIQGNLPHGLSLDSNTGIISGTPDIQGTTSFTIKAIDSIGSFVTNAYVVRINAPLVISTLSLPDWTSNQGSYNETIHTTGGTVPLTFTVSAGTLPHGLSLTSASGAITGIPDTQGSSTFTIQVLDTVGSVDTRQYTVTVKIPVTLSTLTLPPNSVGILYNQVITAAGGLGDKTMTVSNFSDGGTGLLAPATSTNTVTFNSTPINAGTVSFDLLATDTVGDTVTHHYSFIINAAPTASPATLPNAALNVPYNQKVSAKGGTGNVSFTIANVVGSIAGLPINAGPAGTNSFTVSGTPNAAGSVTFDVTATDSMGAATTTSYAISTSGTDQTLSYKQNSYTTYVAPGTTATLAGSMAYFYARDLQLTFTGTFYTNSHDLNEKWLKGVTNSFGNSWYYIVPNGQLFAWDGTKTAQGSTLIGTLDPVYYSYPDLLYHATQATLDYVLAQRLKLAFTGDFHPNYGGQNEKWLEGITNQYGNRWYFIDTTGQFFAWDGTTNQATGTLLASLDPLYWAQPQRLYHAQPNEVTYTIVNNLLQINTVSGFAGRVVVQLSNTTSSPNNQTFTLNFVDHAPVLTITPSGNPTTTEGQPVSLTLSATDADGDPLIFSAVDGNLGYALHQMLGLRLQGSPYLNYGGQNEKWLQSTLNNWYFIKPNGQLFLWDNTPNQATGTLVNTLDPVFYYHLDLLYQPVAGDLAYALNQRLNLTNASANFPQNYGGQNEKWLSGNDGMYFILPNGQFWKWDGTPHQATGTLMATLDSDYYTNIQRLTNAQPNTVVASIVGNTLTLTPAAGFIGNVWVVAQVSDSAQTVSKLFQMTVT